MQAAAGIVPLVCSQCSVSTRAAVIPTIPPQPRLQTRLRPSGQATKQAVTFPRGCAVLQMLPTPKMNPEQTAGLAGLLGTGWLVWGCCGVQASCNDSNHQSHEDARSYLCFLGSWWLY